MLHSYTKLYIYVLCIIYIYLFIYLIYYCYMYTDCTSMHLKQAIGGAEEYGVALDVDRATKLHLDALF